MMMQEAQEALGRSQFTFVEELQGNKFLHCSYSTEKLTHRKENKNLPKVASFVQGFKRGRG